VGYSGGFIGLSLLEGPSGLVRESSSKETASKKEGRRKKGGSRGKRGFFASDNGNLRFI
jgi:hypothetical protein